MRPVDGAARGLLASRQGGGDVQRRCGTPSHLAFDPAIVTEVVELDDERVRRIAGRGSTVDPRAARELYVIDALNRMPPLAVDTDHGQSATMAAR